MKYPKTRSICVLPIVITTGMALYGLLCEITPATCDTQKATAGSTAAATVTTIDRLADWSVVAGHTGAWTFDTVTPQNFDGDPNRAMRSGDEPSSLIYQFPDISNFTATIFTLHSSISLVKVYVSADGGVTFQPIAVSVSPGPRTAGWWLPNVIGPAAALPAGVDAVKIEFNPSGVSWEPQLAEVSIVHAPWPGGYDPVAVRRKGLARRLQGDALAAKGYERGADACYRKAFAVDLKFDSPDILRMAQTTAGIENDRLGEHSQALSLLSEAVDRFHRDQNVESEAQTRMVRAATFNGREADDSLSDYLAAGKLFGQTGDQTNEAMALANAGFILHFRNRSREALANGNAAVAAAEAGGDVNAQAFAHLNLGRIEEGTPQGKDEGATAYALYVQDGDLRGQGFAVTLIADCSPGDPAQVEDYASARTLFLRAGQRQYAAEMGVKAGSVALAHGQIARAAELFEATEPELRETGNYPTLVNCLSYLATTCALLKRNDEAVATFIQALSLSRWQGNLKMDLYCYDGLMDLYEKADKRPVAIVYGKMAVDELQEYRAGLPMTSENDAEFVQWAEATYHRLAGLLIDAGRLPEAQQVLDLLKNDEYSQYIRRSGVDHPGTAGSVSTTTQERAWMTRFQADFDKMAAVGKKMETLQDRKNRLEQEGRLSQWSVNDELGLSAADTDVEAANRHYEALVAELSDASARVGVGTVDVASCSSLQSTLRALNKERPGCVAVCTLVADRALYILLVTPQVIVSTSTPIDPTSMNALIAKFRGELQDPTSDPRATGKQLYDIVFAPIEKNLAAYHAKTLMWSLDGALRYLPIAALYDGHDYIAQRYATTVFTTASRDTLNDDPVAHWNALGVGVSKAHGKFPALNSVPAELHSIVRESGDRLGVIPGKILLDDRFTRKSFYDALAENEGDTPQFPVIHIATHFDLDAANMGDSGLLLGDGTELKISDIATMAAGFDNADLVTLSACDTAVASGSNGSEVDGFGMLAQRRGAKSVIATLWSVDDESTRIFMTGFYQRREAGLSKADAMQQTQLAMLQGTLCGTDTVPAPRSFQHPYYWAPFILIGNWK